MAKEIVQILVDTLIDRAHAGMSSKGPAPYPPDMAWAAIGLHCHAAGPDTVADLRKALADRQREDGSIPLIEDFPQAWWPTSMGLLAWRMAPEFSEPRRMAVDFLLHHRGQTFKRMPGIVGHDTTLHGWPWTDNTHSWVEPTSLALMALTPEGMGKDPAVREAVAMMMDRRLPGGGWNYGNTEVFGSALLPAPECTGMALCALRGELPEAEAGPGLAYLQEEYAGLNTPLALAWTIMGLGAYGRRPSDAEEQVAASLKLQERYGPFSVPHLGLLAACLSDFPFELRGGVA